jgi:hypothetical protein
VGSVVGSTQTPLQLTWVPGHETSHAPVLQTCPFAHAVPLLPVPFEPQPAVAPQCMASLVGSTQLPPQLICVPGHDTEHAPALHT